MRSLLVYLHLQSFPPPTTSSSGHALQGLWCACQRQALELHRPGADQLLHRRGYEKDLLIWRAHVPLTAACRVLTPLGLLPSWLQCTPRAPKSYMLGLRTSTALPPRTEGTPGESWTRTTMPHKTPYTALPLTRRHPATCLRQPPSGTTIPPLGMPTHSTVRLQRGGLLAQRKKSTPKGVG